MEIDTLFQGKEYTAMHPSIKAVLFDLDDTLFDHHHSLQAGLAALRQAYPGLQQCPLDGLTNTYVGLIDSLHSQVLQGLLTQEQARMERIRQLFLAQSGRRLSLAQARSAANLYRQAYQAARRPVPGAVALLKYLRASVQIGIVTNNLSAEQHEKLDFCGLTLWIDALVISDEVGVTKPDPKIFEMALERLGCRPEETVMLGDSWKVDMLGARRAGIAAVWLNRFGSPCPDETLARVIDALEPAQTIAEVLLRPPGQG